MLLFILYRQLWHFCTCIYVLTKTQALNLLEFLELNSMLGVSHFTFYNHTLGPQSSCILKDKMTGCGTVINSTIDGITKSYVRPTVTMLPWVLPIISQKEIRTEGIFAALNDCVYRSMYRYGQMFMMSHPQPKRLVCGIVLNTNNPEPVGVMLE